MFIKVFLNFSEFWEQIGIDINSTVYINNTSENKFLGDYGANKPELVNHLKYIFEIVWKSGRVDNDGYQQLANFKTGNLLTATSSPSNIFTVDKSM